MMKMLAVMMMAVTAVTAMAGVEYAVDERGFVSLAHEGKAMLVHPHDGTLRFNAGREWGEKYPGEAVRGFDDGETQRVRHAYPWGTVFATYARVSDTELKVIVTVSNVTKEAMPRSTVYLARMTYPQVPLIDSVTVVASEFTGGTFASADAASMPPMVLLSYGAERLLVFGHDMTSATSVGVGIAEVGGLVNSVILSMEPLAAGASRTETLSFRGGKEGDTLCSFGEDGLRNYQRAHPMEP
ncbi:MAG: hypothetical protein FWF84_06145, partial [Kiritimatiellaeota bacterium]|nr:hypothetical protein [Kiritimatiellota bacterium]